MEAAEGIRTLARIRYSNRSHSLASFSLSRRPKAAHRTGPSRLLRLAALVACMDGLRAIEPS